MDKEFDDDSENYYEYDAYNRLVEHKPDDFYLHRPKRVPYLKWLYELRLQTLLFLNIHPNYFGMRHRFDYEVQWMYDWVFIHHYQFDHLGRNKWTPRLLDRIRYQWLVRQGYRKEQNNYLELSERNEARKVSVAERKFLRLYEAYHYVPYFNHARDDELAYFRLGVDTDQSLHGEDMPLFPNICYSYPDDARLAYVKHKQINTEHIPMHRSWVHRMIARKKMMRKWESGKKVTYADMRDMFNPDTTKVHDLEFLLHCFEKHDGSPTDEHERLLYNLLLTQYYKEFSHIAQMMRNPILEKFKIAYPRKALNPLYVAYKERWFGVNKVKEFEKVFDGVDYEEYQEIVNMQYASLDGKPRKRVKQNDTRKVFMKRVDAFVLEMGKRK